VNGLPDKFRGVLLGPLLQIDTQPHLSMRRKLLRPTHNKLLRVVVKILLDERGRVHRVEQLAQITQF
jgi:hypothetical protein